MKKIFPKINYVFYFIFSIISIYIISVVGVTPSDVFIETIRIAYYVSAFFSIFTFLFIFHLFIKKENDTKFNIMCLLHNAVIVLSTIFTICFMDTIHMLTFSIDFAHIIYYIICILIGIYSLTKLIIYKRNNKVINKKSIIALMITIVSLLIIGIIIYMLISHFSSSVYNELL